MKLLNAFPSRHGIISKSHETNYYFYVYIPSLHLANAGTNTNRKQQGQHIYQRHHVWIHLFH